MKLASVLLRPRGKLRSMEKSASEASKRVGTAQSMGAQGNLQEDDDKRWTSTGTAGSEEEQRSGQTGDVEEGTGARHAVEKSDEGIATTATDRVGPGDGSDAKDGTGREAEDGGGYEAADVARSEAKDQEKPGEGSGGVSEAQDVGRPEEKGEDEPAAENGDGSEAEKDDGGEHEAEQRHMLRLGASKEDHSASERSLRLQSARTVGVQSDRPCDRAAQTEDRPGDSGVRTGDRPTASSIQGGDRATDSGIDVGDSPTDSNVQADDRPTGSSVQAGGWAAANHRDVHSRGAHVVADRVESRQVHQDESDQIGEAETFSRSDTSTAEGVAEQL